MSALRSPRGGTARAGLVYRERLRVPVRWWIQWGLMVASFWVAMIAAIPGPLPWYITGVLVVVLIWLLRWYGSARIVVTDEWFQAGRARIERRYLGEIEVLDVARMRAVSGPEADVRAFLVLRPYVAAGVRITLDDPRDPAPYWLVSSRRPRSLAKALAPIDPPTTEEAAIR